MSEADPIKRIIAPFVAHGICESEAEALKMLAKDYVQRQLVRYRQRVEHFRSFYQTSVEEFSRQVAGLSSGSGHISALNYLEQREQILRAEDDLEEWEAAEQFLAHWQAVQADLQNASAA
ncbi:MAG: hypothetical protein L0177_08780 [Chloroflexi bacterium]|nr:hypothetical protein [Chloroflexota bacterium]